MEGEGRGWRRAVVGVERGRSWDRVGIEGWAGIELK